MESQSRRPSEPTLSVRLACLAGLSVSCALSIGAWFFLERQEQAAAERLTSTSAAQAALRLHDYIHARLIAVRILANAFSRGFIANKPEFTRESLLIQAEYGGIQAINWIDTKGKILWVVPSSQTATP